MWRVIAVVIVIVGLAVGGYLFYSNMTAQPYEDLERVADTFSSSKLKERHTEFLIESSDDVKFVRLPDKGQFRVEYGKSVFFLYEETMFQPKVTELLGQLHLQVMINKSGEYGVFYKESQLEIYVDI